MKGKMTDEQFESLLYSSMTPEVKKTELQFARKVEIRILFMYGILTLSAIYILVGAIIFGKSCKYIDISLWGLVIDALFHEHIRFYISFLPIYISIFLGIILFIKQCFNIKNLKIGRKFFVFAYMLMIFFQNLFVDKITQLEVYIPEMYTYIHNVLKTEHNVVHYMADGVQSSTGFFLTPVYVMWTIAFVTLIVEIFREKIN